MMITKRWIDTDQTAPAQAPQDKACSQFETGRGK